MVRSRKRRPCNRKTRERAKPPLKSHPAHATTFRAREAVSCICIVYDPASTGQAGQGASRTMRIPANASVVGIISSRSILMWAGRDGGSLRPVGWGGAHPIPSVVCCPPRPPPTHLSVGHCMAGRSRVPASWESLARGRERGKSKELEIIGKTARQCKH